MNNELDPIGNPIAPSGLSRRGVLQTAAASMAAFAFGGILQACGGSGSGSHSSGGGSVSDFDVLNFALNLEYLEANYYLLGTTGSPLPSTLTGSSPGAVTGGAKVSFSTQKLSNLFTEIANHEMLHVQFLRSVLGSSAVSQPVINLQSSFNAAAAAAGLGSSFDPFANETNFLIGAFIFEDVGVTAYNGGATLLQTPAYISAAAEILGTEAYHAAAIRTNLIDAGTTPVSDANAISALRASVGGGNDAGLFVNNAYKIVPVDSTGKTFARTTTEVLNIVYLNAQTTPGGFFPNGLNGNVRGVAKALTAARR